MPTRRETIAELLEETESPLTVTDICLVLDIKNRKLVSEDIEHVARSVRSKGKELVVFPASCGKCAFVFKGRKSVKKPSRCPKCKSEWIIPQAFQIRSKN